MVGVDEELAAMLIWPEVPYCLHHCQQLVSGHAVVHLADSGHDCSMPQYVPQPPRCWGFVEFCLELGEGCRSPRGMIDSSWSASGSGCSGNSMKLGPGNSGVCQLMLG